MFSRPFAKLIPPKLIVLEGQLIYPHGNLPIMITSRFSQRISSFVLVSGIAVGTGTLLAQSAGQDLHHAGTDTKNAAKDTGSGVQKGTTKAYHGTKHTTTKAADKTKEGVTKGYDRTKEGSKSLVGANDRQSTKARDRAKESQQKQNDAVKEDSQKVRDAEPR
jgi:hypothetical protein